MGPDWIKIRVDDNLGATRKMSPDTYQAVISRARYVPTLTREVSTFAYGDRPDFFDDPFLMSDVDSAQVATVSDPEWAGVLYGPEAVLAERVRRRTSAVGMDAAQRALWLAAGLFVDAKEYRPEVVAFVLTGRKPRARHMLNFLVPGWPRRRDLPEPWDDWEAPDIAALFKAFGRWYDPWWGGQGRRYEATTLSLRTDWLLKRWIEILGERTEPESRKALGALARNATLDGWYEELSGAQDMVCPPQSPRSGEQTRL